MTIKITTLVENTTTAGLAPLIGEHGLSFYIEAGDKKILFDAGQGLALINNAKALGIDLSKVDTVVLSHGHFDHAGGLKNLLGGNTDFRLVAHPGVFENKLVGGGGNYHPIGIAGEKEMLENSGITIQLDKKPVEIAPGIRTAGEIPMETDFEEVEAMFFTGEKGKELPDKILDDNALILDTEKGTVVVLGCAHRGPINTLNHVAALTGKKKIHAVLGGLHLMMADAAKLQKIMKCLSDFEIEKLVIGHCTGFKAMAALSNRFENKFVQNTVGLVNEF